jgi:hypothetical protein
MNRVFLLAFAAASMLPAQTPIRDTVHTGVSGTRFSSMVGGILETFALNGAQLGSRSFAGVQVADTIQTPFSGVTFTGKLTISGPKMTTAAGKTVAQWQADYPVGTNGVFSVVLEPNDTATPAGTSYSVRYVPFPSQRGAPWTEMWIVPTSSSPLKINQVRVITIPAAGLVILPQQIGSGGAISGQCLTWYGSSWQPVDCAAGNTSATALQGFAVATTTPSGGMVLTWNATTSRWEPQTVATTSYTATVSSAEYTDGKVTVTVGSDEVTGTGTAWTSDMTGWWFQTQPCLQGYKFTYVSQTSGILSDTYGNPAYPGAQDCVSMTIPGVPSPSGTRYGRGYILTQPTVVPAATHGLGTSNLQVQCYSSDIPEHDLQPAQKLVWANLDVEIAWRRATTGTCVLTR